MRWTHVLGIEAVFRSVCVLNDRVLYRHFGHEGLGPVLVLLGEALISAALFHWTVGWGQIWALLKAPGRRRGKGPRAGADRRREWIIVGFGGIIAFFLVGTLFATFIHDAYQPAIGRGWLGAAFVALFTLSGLVEEIYFRGIVYTGLGNSFGPGVATAVTSAWFALLHTLESPLGLDSIPIFTFIFAFSVAGCLVRRYSRSLLPFAITYSGFNFLNAALGMLS